MPKATATVQILRAVPSPDKPAPAEPEKTTVIIRTGFGGMAAAVAGHHPAG
jgi:hypothetical protein